MRFPRFRIRTLMIAVAGLAVFLSVIAWLGQVGWFEPYLWCKELHPLGNTLVAEIELWRARNGRYPRSLEEAGLTSPTGFHGGFHYAASGEGFALWIGVANGMSYKHEYRSQGGSGASPGWECRD